MNFDDHQNEELRQHYQRKGMGIGMVLLMPFGVGPALGISIGSGIGEAMYKKDVLGE